MDIRLRNLERRALSGDLTALLQYRKLALQANLVPPEIITILAGLNYQPARDIILRYWWPPSSDQATEQLFNHDSAAAACIAYRVIAPAAERLLDLDGLEELLHDCIPIEIHKDDIFLQNHDLMEVLREAFDLIQQMTDCEYLKDLTQRGSRAYSKASNQPWNLGWQYNDSLVLQHYQAGQRVEQIGHRLRGCEHQSLTRGGDFFHLARALDGIADSAKPPVGFIGQRQLSNRLHQIRYFLDGMDYSWSREAYIEAIFSYYLI